MQTALWLGTVQRWARQTWQRRGLGACALWPLSVIYGVLWQARRWLYRRGILPSQRIAVPVIAVGNVLAGGAGKTPLVLALVAHLQRQGVPVGVVSRGYGRRTLDCREVQHDSLPEAVGDEPLLMRRSSGAPVFVAAQRSAAAQALLARHPDTALILCDDALQHWALQRDLEIGVFDERGLGNGWLLPAGPLREPWPRPLDLLLHTATPPAFAGFCAQRRLAAHALTSDGQQVALGELGRHAGKPLLALAAIAKPETFFAMLRAAGVPLSNTLALPDHYNFDSWSRTEYGLYQVICTEKDAVKLWPHEPGALAVPLCLEPEPAFWAAFEAKLAPLLVPTSTAKLSSPHGHTTS